MLREKVRVYVAKDKVTVEAEFWFRNGGSTTTLNVGFPDENSDTAGGPALKNFQSWVDGKKVRTQYRTGEMAPNWHVKRVTFPKGRTVYVRDRYVTNVGSWRIGQKEMFSDRVQYVVHTGASWKGTIGETDLRVYIEPSMPYPRRVLSPDPYWEMSERSLKEGSLPQVSAFLKKHRNTVFASGPSTPKRKGRELIFIRRNWRPTKEDDLDLVLNARRDVALERRIQGD
jgi:hypothetical protein